MTAQGQRDGTEAPLHHRRLSPAQLPLELLLLLLVLLLLQQQRSSHAAPQG